MRWRGCCLLAAGTLALASCAKAPTSRFYALTSQQPPAIEQTRLQTFSIAVGPVDLPEYLDRPQMVTRLAGSQLQVHEFDRWGGLLAEDTARVVADDLSALLGGAQTYLYPSRLALDVDYRIALQVRRFDGVLGEAVDLQVAWSIVDERRAQSLQTDQRSYRAAMRGAGFEDYAEALSAALGSLSMDLAKALNALPHPRRALRN